MKKSLALATLLFACMSSYPQLVMTKMELTGKIENIITTQDCNVQCEYTIVSNRDFSGGEEYVYGISLSASDSVMASGNTVMEGTDMLARESCQKGTFTFTLTELQDNRTYNYRIYFRAMGIERCLDGTFKTKFNTVNEQRGYVDMGLSVKWATCNVGADKPQEYGDYFAWGETRSKNNYYWDTYKYCRHSDCFELTKYCNDEWFGYNGFIDCKTILDPEDDVAHELWGEDWRMPTKEEITELFMGCERKVETINGVKGYLLTSNINGNTIFLPFCGMRNGQELHDVGETGYYWQSTMQEKAWGEPNCCSIGSSGNSNLHRYNGLCVRPVYVK